MDSITNRLYFFPLIYTSLGAVLGFYFLFKINLALIITFIFIILIVLCLFRVLASLDTQSRFLQQAAFCSIAFIIGVVLGLCIAYSGHNDVNFGIPENNITAVEGILIEDPRIISGGRAMAVISLKNSSSERGQRVSSSGEITVFFSQLNTDKIIQFGRGTTIFIEGNLRSTDRGWTYSANSLHIVKPAPLIEQMRTGIRLSLIKRFEKETWGGLALALLLGIRDNLDSDFTDMYREAGLSYILALSGMHLAILAAIIAFILKKPLGLKISSVTGAVIIIFYCLLVGPMPSLNRAALMYILGVITIIFSLPKKAISILSLSFLIQIIITPAAGKTISFILSYLALLGILIIGKALSSLLKGKFPDFLLQPLSISIGAFLATAGICSFVFGRIAPVGIIAGLLIVPLTTIFMIGSIIWLLLDFISLSVLINMPLFFVYKLMEIIASLAGNVPGISANPILIIILSIILSVVILVLEYWRRSALLCLKPFD